MTAPPTCCPDLLLAITHSCVEHPDPFDCPDYLVHRSPTAQPDGWHGFGLVIHDGGRSAQEIEYCPWCGTKLSTLAPPPPPDIPADEPQDRRAEGRDEPRWVGYPVECQVCPEPPVLFLRHDQQLLGACMPHFPEVFGDVLQERRRAEGDARLLRDPDLLESLEQMRRGEGTVTPTEQRRED